MTNQEAKEYLESIISAWKCSTEVDRYNPKYRKVWLSKKDIEAIRQVMVVAYSRMKIRIVNKENKENDNKKVW